jgi:hypothetical protein
MAEAALADCADCTEVHNVLAMASDSHEQCLAHYERAVDSAADCFTDLPGSHRGGRLRHFHAPPAQLVSDSPYN